MPTKPINIKINQAYPLSSGQLTGGVGCSMRLGTFGSLAASDGGLRGRVVAVLLLLLLHIEAIIVTGISVDVIGLCDISFAFRSNGQGSHGFGRSTRRQLALLVLLLVERSAAAELIEDLGCHRNERATS